LGFTVPEHGAVRILHVDDEAAQLDLFRIMMGKLIPGAAITSIRLPREALEVAGGVDCVVTDYKMESLTGIEFTKRIREHSGVPIILYTGHGSEEVAEAAFKAGINDYIRKEMGPSHFQVLAKRIRQVVEAYWSTDLYESIAEGSKDGCGILIDLTFVYANQALADLLEEPGPVQVIGQSAYMWIPEDDKVIIRDLHHYEDENPQKKQ